MKYFLISIFFIAVLTTSCNESGGRFESEVQKVDSLQTDLKELEGKMQSIDKSEAEEKYSEFKPIYSFLLKNYPDSLDRRFWINDMNAMRRIDKAFSRYQDVNKKIEESIENTSHQLKTLRNSLEDEKLTEEEAEKYITEESKAVENIRFLVFKVQPEMLIAKEIHDTIYPRMNRIADSIRRLE